VNEVVPTKSRPSVRRLNLGSGAQPRPGYINVDLRPTAHPDVVADLDRFPYPFATGSFEEVLALDVVEHLSNVTRFMEEVHALLVPGGLLEITTPHFSSSNSFTDPTHQHHFGYFSFDYFTAGSKYSFYSAARFAIEKKMVVFSPSRWNRLVARLANRRPELWERRFCWLFPAWFLIFRLRAVRGA
jgi:SAM-dependent methyltransferase